MPTRKVKGGYQWGKHGKVYPTKAQADKQGRAIYANGWKGESTETIDNIITEITNNVINRIKNGDY